MRGLVGTRISSAEQMDIFGLRIWYIKLLMVNGKQIITRCFAILILCGIILVGGYGLYMSFRDFDKPVPVVTKTDSIGRPFEINGYMFYLRNDALYDESEKIWLQTYQ